MYRRPVSRDTVPYERVTAPGNDDGSYNLEDYVSPQEPTSPGHFLTADTKGPRQDQRRVEKPRASVLQRLGVAWTYGWVAETLSYLLAVLCLAATVILLRVSDRQPLPQWPMGITINALVSVFGVLLKAGLALPLSEGISQLKWQWFSQQPRKLIDIEDFEAASRGPWGSFRFLFRFEPTSPGSPSDPKPGPLKAMQSFFTWRRSYLLNSFAKISALLIVLALAMDPFTQQVIRFVPCQQENTVLPGAVARANTYEAGGYAGYGNLGNLRDIPMAMAINTGVTNPPSDQGLSSLVSYDCPTGNCTFPHFSTFGVCHTCEDITSSIRNNTNVTETSISNFTIPLEPATSDSEEFPEMILDSEWLVAHTVSNYQLLWTKVIGHTSRDDSYRGPAPAAFSCKLRPCIRTIQSEVVNNALQETEIARTSVGVSPLWNIHGYAVPSEDPLFLFAASANANQSAVIVPDGARADCVGSTEAADDLIEVHSSNIEGAAEPASLDWTDTVRDAGLPPTNESLWFPKSCVWYLSIMSFDTMADEIQNQLEDLEVDDLGGTPTLTSTLLWNEGDFGFSHVDSFMRNLSDSMTATMRSHGGPNTNSSGEYVSGQGFEQTTCVEVRWDWLIYTIALVGLAGLWLIILIWQSPRGEVTKRGWKSSALALLLAVVPAYKLLHASSEGGRTTGEGETEEGEEEPMVSLFDTSRSEMMRMAQEADVQLVRDEEGRARFV